MHECVRRSRARDHVRLLTDDRFEPYRVCVVDPNRADELVSVRVLAQCGRCEARHVSRQSVRRALERQERRRHEDERPDERRHRVPGKAEDERTVAYAEGEGLPGLDRHAPEDLTHPEVGSDSAYEVVLSHRHAAGGDEHVRLETARDRIAVSVCVVRDDGQHVDFGVRSREDGGDHPPVGLIDLTRGEHVAGRTQLATRGENGDLRTFRADDLVHAGRGQRSDLCGTETRAGGNHDRSREDVASARTHVLAGERRPR